MSLQLPPALSLSVWEQADTEASGASLGAPVDLNAAMSYSEAHLFMWEALHVVLVVTCSVLLFKHIFFLFFFYFSCSNGDR